MNVKSQSMKNFWKPF